MGRLCLHKTTNRRTINKALSAGERISRKLAYVRQDANVLSGELAKPRRRPTYHRIDSNIRTDYEKGATIGRPFLTGSPM